MPSQKVGMEMPSMEKMLDSILRPAAAAHGREHAEGDGQDRRDEQRGEHQLAGSGRVSRPLPPH